MRKVSLESEINNIIANGVVTMEKDRYINSDFKESTVNGCKYEYWADFEDELRKRARSMSRKKVEKFPVPKTQKVLAVFSKHRDKIQEIIKIVNRFVSLEGCVGGLAEIGLERNEAKDMFYGKGSIPYAMSILPKAYMN